MKSDTRQAVIEAGADLIHRQGYNRTGLKEILDVAGVPKGSFYFYFKSKEEFGLALIDHYAQRMAQMAGPILGDPSLAPIARLRAFFAILREKFESSNCERGCPIGNLAQEMSDLSPVMRERVSRAFAGFVDALAEVLSLASTKGELSRGLDPSQTAAFIVDAWEGALLRMKAEKSIAPLLRFEAMIFDHILR